MLGSLLGVIGIGVVLFLVFLAIDEISANKKEQECKCHCNHDVDGDCQHDCCGCHGCCHKEENDEE